MLPGRVEKQREGAWADALPLYCVPERSWGACKVNDAGKIWTDGRWRGKCLVAQSKASVSINSCGSVNLLTLP